MAASSRISYNANAVAGGMHLGNFTSYQLKAAQELARAYAIAVQVTANGATPANLEGSVEFGAAVGQGAALQAAMIACNTAVAALQTAIATTLAQLDPGT